MDRSFDALMRAYRVARHRRILAYQLMLLENYYCPNLKEEFTVRKSVKKSFRPVTLQQSIKYASVGERRYCCWYHIVIYADGSHGTMAQLQANSLTRIQLNLRKCNYDWKCNYCHPVCFLPHRGERG